MRLLRGSAAAGFLLTVIAGAGMAQERPRHRTQPRVLPVADSVPHPGPRRPPPEGSPAIAKAAAAIREAWLAHDVGKIVAQSPELIVELPGTDPSGPVSRRQAAALLGEFFASAREVELLARQTKESGAGRGFAEFLRQYRVNGTQEVRSQSLYLGYREERGQWVLVELRAIDP